METRIFATVARGAAAGLAASVVQAGIGKTEEKLLLPRSEDADIAPRLMRRLADDLGERLPAPAMWTLGTAFHLGYGAFWGAAYGLAERRLRLRPAAGGLLLGALIYAITFPRWGMAVQTDTERPPERRTWRMTFVAWSVAITFGLATAGLHERLTRR